MKTKFDDNCEELEILRWFRDHYVEPKDIEHYYETAPVIVSAIEASSEKDAIYQAIYDNVVIVCVNAIKPGEYDFAYNRYRDSVLQLERRFKAASVD